SRTISSSLAPSAPEATSATIASGSSERGLSEVITVRSESSAPARPIFGRLSRSRSPPAPKTLISLPSLRRGEGSERVGDVEVAGKAGAQLLLADAEVGAGGVEGDVAGAVVGLGALG